MELANCSSNSLINFPPIDLPGTPLVAALIALCVAAYLFLMMARICDHYFVICIKIISYNIGLSSDVAGATLMAIAVSLPDLFMNCVATFVTEGDIGIGAVVGVCLFSILGVPAFSVLLQPSKVIDIDYWSVTRDVLFFGISILCLIFTLSDFKVEWYESLIFVAIYAVYIVVLCCNKFLRNKIESFLDHYRRKQNISVEKWPLIHKSQSVMSYDIEEDMVAGYLNHHNEDNNSNCFGKCFYCLVGVLYSPIDIMLYMTVPFPRTRTGPSKWYPLTFFICLIWLAVISYLIAWMLTVAGYGLQIPDSLVGLTFIAVGMSVPEVAASVIVARQGHGSMALSNSLGANTFDILICLGLPWVLKAAYYSDSTHEVYINSRGIGYSALMLSASLILFYVLLAMNRFKLSKGMGIIFLIAYLIFACLSALMELNVFFIGNLPTCQ